MVEMLGLPWAKDAIPHTGVVVPTGFRGRSSGAEKSELSKVDMDTHSSKKVMASSVRRFDIFVLSLLFCHPVKVIVREIGTRK